MGSRKAVARKVKDDVTAGAVWHHVRYEIPQIQPDPPLYGSHQNTPTGDFEIFRISPRSSVIKTIAYT
jgi:hypothetical protein